MRRNTSNDGQVLLGHRPRLELRLQCPVRLGILRNEETARRVFVETMHEYGIQRERE